MPNGRTEASMSKIKEKYSDAIHDAGVVESYYKFRHDIRLKDWRITEQEIKQQFIEQLTRKV